MPESVLLTHNPLNINEILLELKSVSVGATFVFIGTTRDSFNDKKVLKLEYEAYRPMAVKKISELCDHLRQNFHIHDIIVHHRLGEVRPGEASVVIAISSVHRKSSLRALELAIERLKSNVPIWKKEIYDNGSEWKSNAECPWSKENQELKLEEPTTDLVQMMVPDDVIEARIEAFVARKRSECDALNVKEFCNRGVTSQIDGCDPSSCARIDSTSFTRPGRRSKAKNDTWKQSEDEEDCVASKSRRLFETSSGISERVMSLENQVFGSNHPVPKDLYARLKALEDRVLYLEGLSPEYFPLSRENKAFCKEMEEGRQEILDSLPHVDAKIEALRSKIRNSCK